MLKAIFEFAMKIVEASWLVFVCKSERLLDELINRNNNKTVYLLKTYNTNNDYRSHFNFVRVTSHRGENLISIEYFQGNQSRKR